MTMPAPTPSPTPSPLESLLPVPLPSITVTATPLPVEALSVDWGSVAEWTGALVAIAAVIVGGIALRYNRKAVDASTQANKITGDAYQADVIEREQAQARFVYSLVVMRRNFAKGDKAPRAHFTDWSAAGHVFEDDRMPDGRLNPEGTFAGDWSWVVFEAHNASQEIVGPIAFAPFQRDGNGEFGIATGNGKDLPLMPGESVKQGFFVPGPLTVDVGSELYFRDSGGRWWRRRDYDPVERLDGPPAVLSFW